MAIISKKLCMIGDFGVGKTSLIRRFVERQFSDQYLSTVGVKISRKIINLQHIEADLSQEIKLLIWDIEGQTKFKAIASSYLQGASGILVVADSTRPETIDHLQDHVKQFVSINSNGMIAVALNKIDLMDSEDIEQIRKNISFSEHQMLGIYNTSAKTGQNVDHIFETLALKIWRQDNE